MVTSSDCAPSGTSTVVVWVTPSAMLGRAVLEEPSGPPASLPSRAAYLLVTFQETAAGVPTLASGTVTVSGSKAAPSTVTSSLYGLSSSGDVRRDSTSISQTPGCGSA
ncbi:hypothetical protein SGLAM104S_03303 [Streptomyces glaucescens]